MKEEYKNIFTPMEIDAVGEIMNISLGSSATAISNLLDRRVDITTPRVDVLDKSEFQFSELEPAIGVQITYVSGLEGNNIMLLKRNDIRKILEILMFQEIPEEEFVLDELALSAVCEVMNQMMGAASTAMAEFLGEPVNISTPISFEVDNAEEFKDKYYDADGPMVIISFDLSIEGCIESEFMTMMAISLAKKIINASGFGALSDAPAAPAPEPQPAPAPQAQPAPAPEPQPAPMPQAQPAPAPEPQPAPMPQAQPAPTPEPQPAPMPQAQPAPAPQPQPAPMPQVQPVWEQPPAQPKVIHVNPIEQQRFHSPELSDSESSNLDMLMSVPLQVSVEIGRTKKNVKDVLDFCTGTLVVLDKMAGDQVDVFVNGQKVARGDVVVVDDSFGVRITEILKTGDFFSKNR